MCVLIVYESRGQSPNGLSASGTKPKWWILIGDQNKRVANNSILPANNTLDVVKEGLGVAACEQDRKPDDDDRYAESDPQEEQCHIMRDGQEPLDER